MLSTKKKCRKRIGNSLDHFWSNYFVNLGNLFGFLKGFLKES